ncbi:MAG: ATP-binding protein [Oscillospiraceae bacterium]
MNAVQNALLYSPKETEPILTVCYRESRGRKFVEIRVVNESSMFSSRISAAAKFQLPADGYGIPIIKRFVQVSGGWFDMTEENGRVTVTISLPAAHYGSGAELPLRKPSAAQYDTGIPDFTEIMMREVVQFFGESAESAE